MHCYLLLCYPLPVVHSSISILAPGTSSVLILELRFWSGDLGRELWIMSGIIQSRLLTTSTAVALQQNKQYYKYHKNECIHNTSVDIYYAFVEYKYIHKEINYSISYRHLTQFSYRNMIILTTLMRFAFKNNRVKL